MRVDPPDSVNFRYAARLRPEAWHARAYRKLDPARPFLVPFLGGQKRNGRVAKSSGLCRGKQMWKEKTYSGSIAGRCVISW
jgi:hypothetical protein